MLADGGKGLPAAEYAGAAVSFDNPGHTYPKALSVAIEPVQSGSGTPSPDNVRPISGWDGVRVTRCGKNLCHMADYSNVYYNVDISTVNGEITLDGTATGRVDYSYINGRAGVYSNELTLPAGTYTFSVSGLVSGVRVIIGGAYSAISYREISTDGSYTFTLNEEGATGYNLLRVDSGTSVSTTVKIQLEVGSVATEYEPCLGETYSIAFPAGAGTVYGGTLDVTTGLLTVDRGMVDLGTLEWKVEAAGGAHPNWNNFYAAVPNAKGYFAAYGTTQICSHYANQTAPTWNDKACRFGFSSANINISDSALSGYTAAQFKAAMSGVQLVYELTTPVTYQLDPVAVALLQGLNTIWADAGDVTVLLGALGDVQLEAVAGIGGTEYADLPAAPVVNRALMQGGLSVGNAVSASCALSVRTGDSLPRAAEVLLKMRLTDGETASEWLPVGTFYISRRSVDPVTGIISLECYDALLKANALWEPEEGDLPMTMADAAEALAGLLGVELDERNDIATGAAYVIDSLAEGETIRDTLARIAVANGGNWIITPANKLRLVPLADAADAAAATADALDVEGVTGGISVQPASVVTGIRYGGEGGDAILGDDTGTVIDIGENAAFLQVLYDRLVGLTFRPFDLAGAVYDPAAELGDYVRAGANGEVASVLHSEVASYGPGFTGTLSAPQGGELADEYPYIGGAANKALLAARAYARPGLRPTGDRGPGRRPHPAGGVRPPDRERRGPGTVPHPGRPAVHQRQLHLQRPFDAGRAEQRERHHAGAGRQRERDLHAQQHRRGHHRRQRGHVFGGPADAGDTVRRTAENPVLGAGRHWPLHLEGHDRRYWWIWWRRGAGLQRGADPERQGGDIPVKPQRDDGHGVFHAGNGGRFHRTVHTFRARWRI